MKTAVPILLTLHGVSGFGSPSSTFTRTLAMVTSRRINVNLVMYEVSKDPPSNGSGKNSNPWSVLANTEKWISTILGKADASNPYTRKEVSYMCELSDDDALVVAGIWRRLRESREQGQMHGTTEEQRLVGKPTDYLPPTFRQTQVIVVPNDSNLNDFQVFNSLITKINSCRRNARDFVLDINLKKLDAKKGNEVGERDWSVSVNCAHLHPKFGELTTEEKLQEMKEEEKAGEVDVHLEAYKRKRLLARQSPYPTICIEVRATPPTDFGAVGPPPSMMRESPSAASAQEEDSKVTSENVQKLEALFGKSAVVPTQERTPKEEENAFYDSIGNVIEEIASDMSPLHQSQNWIASYHEGFDIQKSTFTTTNCQEVDGGYEFVFNNIAMQVASHLKMSSQYLVFSNFMCSSATSFEKFAREVTALLHLMPSLEDKISISTLHPEHIDPNLRCPVPVLIMNWN